MNRLLCITLGDPFSINIEAVATILASHAPVSVPIVVFGSRWHWDHQCQKLGLSPVNFVAVCQWTEIHKPGLYFWDDGKTEALPADRLSPDARGKVAIWALDQIKKVPPVMTKLAVLTGPVDKADMAFAGFSFPGQTEFFEDLWKTSGIMILAGPRLKVGLITNHVALKDVTHLVSGDLIRHKIQLFHEALKVSFGIAQPRLAVCGLNPHCGDRGLFGREDQEIVLPAVQEMQKRGITVEGPLPADTLFFRGYQGHYDGVLAMYHDQGLGPLKTVHFYDAVNLTGGLPHLRVSPDHGPARDMYLQKQARLDSFQNAWNLCLRYIES